MPLELLPWTHLTLYHYIAKIPQQWMTENNTNSSFTINMAEKYYIWWAAAQTRSSNFLIATCIWSFNSRSIRARKSRSFTSKRASQSGLQDWNISASVCAALSVKLSATNFIYKQAINHDYHYHYYYHAAMSFQWLHTEIETKRLS